MCFLLKRTNLIDSNTDVPNFCIHSILSMSTKKLVHEPQFKNSFIQIKLEKSNISIKSVYEIFIYKLKNSNKNKFELNINWLNKNLFKLKLRLWKQSRYVWFHS
jgi:hypothetical protein